MECKRKRKQGAANQTCTYNGNRSHVTASVHYSKSSSQVRPVRLVRPSQVSLFCCCMMCNFRRAQAVGISKVHHARWRERRDNSQVVRTRRNPSSLFCSHFFLQSLVGILNRSVYRTVMYFNSTALIDSWYEFVSCLERNKIHCRTR